MVITNRDGGGKKYHPGVSKARTKATLGRKLEDDKKVCASKREKVFSLSIAHRLVMETRDPVM
jgi:hypothetical protein